MISLMRDAAVLSESDVIDPELRNHIERVCRDLDSMPIEVLRVKQVRDALKQVRKRVQEGGVTLIADRGEVGDASETTVMISVHTLHRMVIEVIKKSAEIHQKRGTPADILAGLPPLPTADADFHVDLNGAAAKDAGRISSFVNL